MKNKLSKSVLCIILASLLLLSFTACNSSFDAEKNISVVTREDGSGTKSAFMEIIGLKGKADVSGVIVGTGTAGVLAEVKGNPSAIAFESLGYVTADVKTVKVDGVDATVENIKNGSYKVARPLNVIYRENTVSSGAEKEFLTFLQSKDAQEIVSENGYVSLYDEASSYVVTGGLVGEITISGSTSLQPLMILLAEKFETLQSGVTVTVSGGGSGTGYKNAEGGVSDFGMISENFNSSKAASCTPFEVAKDGIAIIVNKANPLETISSAELKNLYNAEESAETKLTKWSDLIK